MSEPEVDTSTGAVMKVVRALQSVDEAQCYEMPWTTFEACQSGASLVRALLAERDALRSLLDGAVENAKRYAAERDAAVARASEHGAYRSAASAFLASKGQLGEFDAWCAERGMPADAVARPSGDARRSGATGGTRGVGSRI